MLRMSCLASCWCFCDTVNVCVGVDVATSGKASELRATWVRIGGMVNQEWSYKHPSTGKTLEAVVFVIGATAVS